MLSFSLPSFCGVLGCSNHAVAPVQKRRSGKSKSKDGADSRRGARVPTNIDTLLCEKCAAGHHEDKIILCDRCDKGYHLFCLSPPLDDVPEGEWICPECVQQSSENIFFRSGVEMTFREMREWNDSFASGWFPDGAAVRTTLRVTQHIVMFSTCLWISRHGRNHRQW
jgi:[histone H3]-trimethyl-L-lysine4 demethylase